MLEDEAGRIVGSLGLLVTEDGALHLGMGVVRAARGSGGGGALLDAALAFAAAAGRSVVLEVYTSNERAIALYERRGFAVTAELPGHFERRDGSRRDVAADGVVGARAGRELAHRHRKRDAGGSGRLLQHHDVLGRHRLEPAGGLADRLGRRVVGIGATSGSAGVRLLAQRHRERHLPEQRHVELVGQELAAALAEDREALAVGVTKPDMFSITPQMLELDLARPSRPSGARPSAPRPAAS